MATVQDDVARGIVTRILTWTTLIAGAGYSTQWEDIARAGSEGLARCKVVPGEVSPMEEGRLQTTSGLFRGLFELRFEMQVRDNTAEAVTAILRQCRIEFNPESRALQTAIAGLSGLSGKWLGRFARAAVETYTLSDSGTLSGGTANPQAPVLLVTVQVDWAENLS